MSKAATVAPRATRAYVLRAELHRQAGRMEQALADLGRAVELEPAFVGHTLARGKLHYERKQYDDAEVDFERVF